MADKDNASNDEEARKQACAMAQAFFAILHQRFGLRGLETLCVTLSKTLQPSHDNEGVGPVGHA